MHCRSVICGECATRLEGINYCHACLSALGRKTEPPASGRFSRGVTAFLVLAGTWLFFAGLFWLVEGKFAP